MAIRCFVLAVVTSLGLPQVAKAANCDKPLGAGLIYQCALQKDPRIRSLVVRAKEREGRELEAKQLPNPVAEVEGTSEELSASIVQPFEIGGKRSSRIALGKIENQISLVEDEIEFAAAALDIVQNVFRLSQLNTKLSLLEDTKRSLVNLASRLRAKSVRSPEERTALGLFQMQGSVVGTRILALRREQEEARLELEASLGTKLPEPEKLMVEIRKWPALNSGAKNQALNARLRELALKRVQAEADVQRSQAWPDLAVGPYFSKNNSDGESNIGAKLELGLPLWNRNRGARQRAEATAERAKIEAERSLAISRLSVDVFADAYRKLTEFLAQSSSSRALQRSVAETLQLFSRGMVQPANVIETYRTAFESMEAVQEAELAAITYYWTVQAAKGEVPKEIP